MTADSINFRQGLDLAHEKATSLQHLREMVTRLQLMIAVGCGTSMHEGEGLQTIHWFFERLRHIASAPDLKTGRTRLRTFARRLDRQLEGGAS